MIRNALDQAVAAAVESWGWVPGNPGENRVIAALHAAGVKPEDTWQQFRIGPYRLDICWPQHRIAIECDGWVHTTRDAARKDRERDKLLRRWGWLVERIDVDQPEEALRSGVARLVREIPALCRTRAEAELRAYHGEVPDLTPRPVRKVSALEASAQARAIEAHRRLSPMDRL